MTFDEQMDLLDESLRKIRVKYEQFFIGVRRVPPTVERAKLDSLIHEMSRVKLREVATRFKFNMLVARYNNLRELWSRMSREREEGPMDYRRRRAVLSEVHPAPADSPPPPQEPRVTSAAADSYVRMTEASDTAALATLHGQITAAQQALGTRGKPPSIPQLEEMVRKQLEAARSRYGAISIELRVETTDGKVKLKAKPLREP